MRFSLNSPIPLTIFDILKKILDFAAYYMLCSHGDISRYCVHMSIFCESFAQSAGGHAYFFVASHDFPCQFPNHRMTRDSIQGDKRP